MFENIQLKTACTGDRKATHIAPCNPAVAKARAVPLFGAVLALMVLFSGDAYAQLFSPASTASLATQSQAVKALLTQQRVVKNKNGSESLEDASKVKPGDILEYKVTYTNNTAQPIKNLVANLPIPQGLDYQPRSAKPGVGVTFATSAGVYGAEPLIRKYGLKTEPVPYEDYRQLRWSLSELPAHGVSVVSARARVETVIPTTPAAATPASPASAMPIAIEPKAR